MSAQCSGLPNQRHRGLFDDFGGGGREGHRHVDAERPGGLEVEDELKLGCLHHRQLAGLLALENAIDIRHRMLPAGGGAPRAAQVSASRTNLRFRSYRFAWKST